MDFSPVTLALLAEVARICGDTPRLEQTTDADASDADGCGVLLPAWSVWLDDEIIGAGDSPDEACAEAIDCVMGWELNNRGGLPQAAQKEPK